MRKFEHSGDTNKKFQKKLDKGSIPKNKDSKIKKSKDRLDGEDFGKKYDELFNKYAKEYPKYQDPASVPFDINSQDSIDLFQKNSQIKEQIIARVTAELKKGETAPVTKESEVSKNIDIISRTEAPDIVNQLNEEPIQEEPVVENQTIDKNEVTVKDATIIKVMEENTPTEQIKKDPLSKKELETATIYDLQKRGYTTKDPEFDMVLKRGIAKTEARINRIANENNKEAKNEQSQKINMLFEMGGPQAGDILNVNENGKTFKYTIKENDGKNVVFTIDDGGEQKIGLRQAKEFLSKKGISFEFAGEPENEIKTEKEVVAEEEIPEGEIEVDNSEEEEKKVEEERIKKEKFDEEFTKLVANHFKLEKAYNDKLAKYEKLKKKIEAKKAKENLPVAETENTETENEEIPTEQKTTKGEETGENAKEQESVKEETGKEINTEGESLEAKVEDVERRRKYSAEKTIATSSSGELKYAEYLTGKPREGAPLKSIWLGGTYVGGRELVRGENALEIINEKYNKELEDLKNYTGELKQNEQIVDTAEQTLEAKIADIEKMRQEGLSLAIIDESKVNNMVDKMLGNASTDENKKKDQIKYTFENNLINGLANKSLSQVIRETGKRNTIKESMYWLTGMTEYVRTIEKGKELGFLKDDEYKSLIGKFEKAKNILQGEVDEYVHKINAKYDKELEDLKK